MQPTVIRTLHPVDYPQPNISSSFAEKLRRWSGKGEKEWYDGCILPTPPLVVRWVALIPVRLHPDRVVPDSLNKGARVGDAGVRPLTPRVRLRRPCTPRVRLRRPWAMMCDPVGVGWPLRKALNIRAQRRRRHTLGPGVGARRAPDRFSHTV
jgi:hypothetical protein